MGRLSLVTDLRTRPASNDKDARTVNAYIDQKLHGTIVRKRPVAVGLPISPVLGFQLFDSVLDARTNVGFASPPNSGGGESSGTVSSNNWTSSTKTTVANCTSVSSSVKFLSIRGVGDGRWYRRSIRWRFEYYNGSWVQGPFRTVPVGDQTTVDVADSGAVTFPSAGVWEWRIYAEAFDTDGTAFGSSTYTYTQETVTAPNVLSGQVVPTTTQAFAINASFNAPSGTAEIYQITYNATPSATVQFASPGSDSNGMTFVLGYGWPGVGGTYATLNDAPPRNLLNTNITNRVMATDKVAGVIVPVTEVLKSWAPGAQSHTVSGSNLTFNSTFWALGCKRRQNTGNTMLANMSLASMSATIFRRTLSSSNSTSPVNTYGLDSYSWSVLGSGVGSGIDPTKSAIYIVNDEVGLVDLSEVFP